MKKALVAFFSQGGTTEKIATEISKGLSDKGYAADLYSITDKSSPPNVKDYDLIGVGCPAYIARLRPGNANYGNPTLPHGGGDCCYSV